MAKVFGHRELWRENAGGGWSTAVAVLSLLILQFLRALIRRLSTNPHGRWTVAVDIDSSSRPSASNPPSGIERLVGDDDLSDLIAELGRVENEKDEWEEVVSRRNANVEYKAWCSRKKDGPPKYLSISTYERCNAEILKDFYMDNEYRSEWDNTIALHEQLQVDYTSGTEVGRTVKRFPFLMPREYITAWRIWAGKENTFYCIVKDCQHSLAPQQKKFVRVCFLRSRWCIRKVPNKEACEIIVVHQEDNGMNIQMAKLAFARGIWSYVCKMDKALRAYSATRSSRSASIRTVHNIIKKVPASLETSATTSNTANTPANRPAEKQEIARTHPRKMIATGIFILSSAVCLCQGHPTLAAQLAMACILRKIGRKAASAQPANSSHQRTSN